MVDENYWLYDWKTNGVVKDATKWSTIFTSSIDLEFNFNNRWNMMTKAPLIADKHPPCLTGNKRKTITSSKKVPPVKGTLEEVEAARCKRRNKKKKKVYADVNLEQEIKDRVWKEHLASNRI